MLTSSFVLLVAWPVVDSSSNPEACEDQRRPDGVDTWYHRADWTGRVNAGS